MTPASPLILIYGDSLLLAGLEASLRGAPGVQVLHLSRAQLQTCQVCETWQVLDATGGVLVYDRAETDLGQLAPWLTACPGLTLLGLDAEHDRIHVVTGRSQAVAAVGELTRVVLEAVGGDTGAG